MKKFCLIANEIKDPQGVYAGRITSYLERHGGETVRVVTDSADHRGHAAGLHHH